MNKADVQRVAELARLEFSETELEAFTKEFSSIVEYVGSIASLDLKDVTPLSSVSGAINVERDDVVGECLDTETALKNAPKKNESFFKVPKVLG